MIVVDWGTSSFRAYRLDAGGGVAERREGPHGILAVADGDFGGVLATVVGDWLAAEPGDLWLAGMIGSRQGWVEAPYAACPAGPAEIAAAVRAIDWQGRRLNFVPGLSCREADGAHDVLRGEEVQILGVMAAIGAAPATVVLPGTHSKWARVAAGRVHGFRTHMTGEAFAVMRRHSILGRTMPEGAEANDAAAFARGLARATTGGGLLSHLFSVRTAALFDEVAPAALPSLLSGILIGHELAAALAEAPDGPVHVVAGPALARLYADALAAFGRRAEIHDPDAAARGLHALATMTAGA